MRALLRFDLLLPAGRAWLELPCNAPGQGLEQARALAAALPLLADLELWWGTDLPCPEPSVPGADSEHARTDAPAVGDDGLHLAFEPGSALAGGQLCVPWAALSPGRPPPASLPVQWPQRAAQMRLQTLALERVDPAGLVPGAVLLLPTAFSHRWSVHLQDVETSHTAVPNHWRAPATWLPHEGQLLWGDAAPVAATATAADSGPWSVWLVPPLSVDLRAWLGAGPTPPSPAPAAPGLVELRLDEQPVAWGRLLPCGAGWALRLDRVVSQQAVPAWT